jgi:hypothetical protein
MDRRQLLKSATMLSAPVLLSGCQGELKSFTSWRYGREAVLELLFNEPKLQGSPWSLNQMLQHAAQSIEFSMQGFPQLRGAWFRHSVGAAAFTVFNARGAMSHALDEPIPGAPALDAGLSLKGSVQRLLDAMDDFSRFKGKLAPHFAYGELTREQYQRAHLMHLANHWQQLHAPK